MYIKPIHTDQDYEEAMARIDALSGADIGSVEGYELEVLAILVEAYENKYYPIAPPDPVTAIKFRMEQQWFTPDRSTR
jgi:HTH-type transcriptional regulator/antitoxin HigA